MDKKNRGFFGSKKKKKKEYDIFKNSLFHITRHYLLKCDALIYVIDSSDRNRFEESRNELDDLLKCEYLKNAKILIYANKQDLENCLGEKEIYEKLKLKYDTHVSLVMPCSAVNGKGVNEGLEWLAKNL